MSRLNAPFCLLLILAAAPLVHAGTLPADALPLPNRVARADVVVLGKVKAVEEKMVSAPTFPGSAAKADFRVVVIEVSEAIIAPKGTKTLRVAYVPTPPMVAVSPRPFEPNVGAEGLFFLHSRPDAD